MSVDIYKTGQNRRFTYVTPQDAPSFWYQVKLMLSSETLLSYSGSAPNELNDPGNGFDFNSLYWARKSLQILFLLKHPQTMFLYIFCVNPVGQYIVLSTVRRNNVLIRREFWIAIRAGQRPAIICQMRDKSPCKYPACQAVRCLSVSVSDICSYKRLIFFFKTDKVL